MNHPTEDQLLLLANDELAAPLGSEIASHIAACQGCADRLARRDIDASSQVCVIGCVEGYRWCDVTAGPNRGWVYAQFLSYPYQNQPVPIISGGAILGLPLITFSIGPYWDSY